MMLMCVCIVHLCLCIKSNLLPTYLSIRGPSLQWIPISMSYSITPLVCFKALFSAPGCSIIIMTLETIICEMNADDTVCNMNCFKKIFITLIDTTLSGFRCIIHIGERKDVLCHYSLISIHALKRLKRCCFDI